MRKRVFQTTDTIPDPGCDDGILTRTRAEKVSAGEAFGSDISGEMIVYARSHFSVTEQSNLSNFVADFFYLPFKSGFSVVFSNSSLHRISDYRSLLAEIYQVLCVPGRFFASRGGRGNMGF
ncbi:MAG: class I SAM-dependent methyltransferase [Methanospirillaceae archaeon]|nr:class I SAM-dependent methyltransferase [Methanospirillaceae archaeon]